jgi:two-component system phosphate regulon sensor histidine kinase PhoR
MNKKIISIITIISSLSLIGVVVIQLLWANYALELRKEIFNNRTQVFLEKVVSEITNNENCENSHETCPLIKNKSHASCASIFVKVHNINIQKLDSMMKTEFCERMKVNKDYVYGIIDYENKQLITCSNKLYYNELLNTYHTYPIPCYANNNNKYLGIYFPNQNIYILNRMIFLLIVSTLFLLVVIVSFLLTVFILLRQKKLSEMKSDFVNNMTHEFKTPISTISLASEMLTKSSVLESKEKILQYANIIFDENARLKTQVEQVLQISVLDKKKFKLLKKDIDIHAIIENVVENFQLVVQQRDGIINLDLNADPSHIFADPIHFYHIISNLIDNANKYSLDAPLITISTNCIKTGIIITIEDNGIGISSDNIKHVFKKLYRVPTGNIHNVKGFGLGLYYVKTMVEAHGGNIKLKSEIKKGSTFEIFFPFNHNINI